MIPLLCAALALPHASIQESEWTPKQRKALVQVGHLAIAAVLFREFNGEFPRGLRDVIVRPKDASEWPEGGFLGVEAIPKDPWGNDYEYDPRGDEPKVWTWGADGAPGGEGENADLSAKDLFQSAAGEAKIAATRATLAMISQALETFALDCARYPEKLGDLVRKPTYAERWSGPYLMSDPKDGWGREIVYRVPGAQGRPYDLISFGADGREGGEGLNADISNPLARSEPPLKTAKSDSAFKFDPWEAWASFDKGSWVEQESTAKFGDMPENKSSMKTTIVSKTDQQVKGDRAMQGFDMKDQVLADKQGFGGWAGGEGNCPMPDCGKPMKNHKKPDQKWSREEVDVAGKKILCEVCDQTSYDCKGDRQYVSKTWYSKEIPGWVARSESEMFGVMKGTYKTVTTAYEKR